MRLVWDDQALRDLVEIRRYIAERNPQAAERVAQRLRAALAYLPDRPRMGRTGRVPGTREFVFTDLPYIGVYRIDEGRDTLEILRIVHTARFYPPAEQPDDGE